MYLILGMMLIGWVLPEFVLCLSTRDIRLPFMINVITSVGMGLLSLHFVGGFGGLL